MFKSPAIITHSEDITDYEWYSKQESKLWQVLVNGEVDVQTMERVIIITEPDTTFSSYYVTSVRTEFMAKHLVKLHNSWLIEQMSKD